MSLEKEPSVGGHPQESAYISCIKINGMQILPPLITPEKRVQISGYRKQAAEVERRLNYQRELKKFINEMREDSEYSLRMAESSTVFDDDSHIDALAIPDISVKVDYEVPLRKCNLTRHIFDVTEYNDNGIVLFTPASSRVSEDDMDVVREDMYLNTPTKEIENVTITKDSLETESTLFETKAIKNAEEKSNEEVPQRYEEALYSVFRNYLEKNEAARQHSGTSRASALTDEMSLTRLLTDENTLPDAVGLGPSEKMTAMAFSDSRQKANAPKQRHLKRGHTGRKVTKRKLSPTKDASSGGRNQSEILKANLQFIASNLTQQKKMEKQTILTISDNKTNFDYDHSPLKLSSPTTLLKSDCANDLHKLSTNISLLSEMRKSQSEEKAEAEPPKPVTPGDEAEERPRLRSNSYTLEAPSPLLAHLNKLKMNPEALVPKRRSLDGDSKVSDPAKDRTRHSESECLPKAALSSPTVALKPGSPKDCLETDFANHGDTCLDANLDARPTGPTKDFEALPEKCFETKTYSSGTSLEPRLTKCSETKSVGTKKSFENKSVCTSKSFEAKPDSLTDSIQCDNVIPKKHSSSNETSLVADCNTISNISSIPRNPDTSRERLRDMIQDLAPKHFEKEPDVMSILAKLPPKEAEVILGLIRNEPALFARQDELSQCSNDTSRLNVSTPLLIDLPYDSDLESNPRKTDLLNDSRSSGNFSQENGKSFGRELFPLDADRSLNKLKQQWAASVITAAAKGFLVRRLKRTEKVKYLIKTIEDTLLCALSLHKENAESIRQPDVELHRRLIQQLTAACYEFHDVFFNLTPKEQMHIIALDRERQLEKQKRCRSGTGIKIESYLSTPKMPQRASVGAKLRPTHKKGNLSQHA